MKRESIFISAPGVICSAGVNRNQFFKSAIDGDQTGITQITVSNGKSFFVGKVKDSYLNPVCDSFDMRVLKIADAALNQIQSKIEAAISLYGAERIAVCAGSCDNGSDCSLDAHKSFFSKNTFPENYKLKAQGAAYPASYISKKFGLTGPSIAITTACASSAGAIIKAAELIKSGLCDAAIAGGVDVASETVLLGFDSLEAISNNICNPFSKNRNGITIGEGAAFYVISNSDFSKSGIKLLGYGESADAYHMTAPHSNGEGAAKAMREAILDANINPEDIGYINLHGTGTLLNDSMEAKAVAAIFKKSIETVPVSSTKPITGHTLGAAAALELSLCWMLLNLSKNKESKFSLPVHCWDSIYDDALPHLHFAGKGEYINNLNICMSNSFAFGGCNNSLIIGKED